MVGEGTAGRAAFVRQLAWRDWWAHTLAARPDLATATVQPGYDQIVWRHPLAKLLLNSPSMQLLRWVQSEFPTLHPGGITDSKPLMAPTKPRPDPGNGKDSGKINLAGLGALKEGIKQ